MGRDEERAHADLVATEGDVTRLRIILRGERVFVSESGATFGSDAGDFPSLVEDEGGGACSERHRHSGGPDDVP